MLKRALPSPVARFADLVQIRGSFISPTVEKISTVSPVTAAVWKELEILSKEERSDQRLTCECAAAWAAACPRDRKSVV